MYFKCPLDSHILSLSALVKIIVALWPVAPPASRAPVPVNTETEQQLPELTCCGAETIAEVEAKSSFSVSLSYLAKLHQQERKTFQDVESRAEKR